MRNRLKDARFLLTSPNAYNGLGVGTTQLYARAVVYNHKGHGAFEAHKARWAKTPKWQAFATEHWRFMATAAEMQISRKFSEWKKDGDPVVRLASKPATAHGLRQVRYRNFGI